jgi:hypothetical protein
MMGVDGVFEKGRSRDIIKQFDPGYAAEDETNGRDVVPL